MGILTLLQHKEAAVAEPPAKNTSIFVAESTEGAGTEEEVLAERPAIKNTTKFYRFIMGDSRNILGIAAAEAVKTETAASAETGIIPSATKAALVTVAFVLKEESTAFNIETNAVVTAEYKAALVPKAGDITIVGTFLVQPGKKIKVNKITGALTNVKFSVQLMN